MKRSFFRVTGITVLIFAVMSMIVAGVPSMVSGAEPIKIGLLEPFSGPFEAYGAAWLAGVQFAVDEQNAKGGLFGRKIEIIKEDDEMMPDVAIRKAKKLMLEHKVDILTSGMGSHIAIALNKLATSSKILYINYGAMADDVQGKEFSPYSFRVCFNDYSQLAALVSYIAKQPYKRFYGIHIDYAAGYSKDNALKTQLKLQVPSASVVGTDFHPFGTKDFGPYITKVMASKADAIVATGYGQDLLNLITQTRAMGVKLPIFAPLGAHPYVINQLKEAGAGIVWSHEYSLRINTPENQDMIKRYHEKHKNDRDFLTRWPFSDIGMTILGWKMTFAAIEKAGSLDLDKVVKAFENFQWKSPLGSTWTMRGCDHQLMVPMFAGMLEAGPNPYYNFPWEGPNPLQFPADKMTLPATAEYNSRCGK
jgi:branched-chain amino acid transport system substrate-binding protein